MPFSHLALFTAKIYLIHWMDGKIIFTFFWGKAPREFSKWIQQREPLSVSRTGLSRALYLAHLTAAPLNQHTHTRTTHGGEAVRARGRGDVGAAMLLSLRFCLFFGPLLFSFFASFFARNSRMCAKKVVGNNKFAKQSWEFF